ncbi:nitroreductase family protein [Chitinispirillales bacterium ANBcel5]|uniref:nitroreductase family protein n=1 Tax=Cellulosispirillum alkaliphilum TaxID=3039283 RepID=UPI002A578EDA|nr:nitroreductase family protein [Chitinispirillales bacterium ANBcel5]
MLEMLRKRKSIRCYQDKPIEPQTKEALKEVLLLCPSSRNINPWEFVFVEDRSKLLKLSYSKEHGSAFLKDAALGVVICADETKSDVWVEDCSICAILLQMEAQNRGLGSCWIQIRNRKHNAALSSEYYVKEVLSIADNIRVDSIISIGYPGEQVDTTQKRELQVKKIHSETW